MHSTGKATVLDISRWAGVSTATVSRVLNDRPHVHPQTRQRVLKVIQEINYVPNVLARNLSLNHSDTIAAVFPWFGAGYYSEVLRGIDEVACKAGLHVILGVRRSHESGQDLVMRCIREQRIAGLIILDPTMDDELVNKLLRQECPFVLIERSVHNEHADCVMLDNFNGAREVTQHLIQQGCKRILFITGDLQSDDARERLRGYQATLRESGIPESSELILEGRFTREDVLPKLERYFKNHPLPDAVFASNDDMALGVHQYLTRVGCKSHKNVALAGFDGIEITACLEITTAKVPMRDMGAAAARLLLGRLGKIQKGEHSLNSVGQKIVLQTELIVRNSTMNPDRRRSRSSSEAGRLTCKSHSD